MKTFKRYCKENLRISVPETDRIFWFPDTFKVNVKP